MYAIKFRPASPYLTYLFYIHGSPEGEGKNLQKQESTIEIQKEPLSSPAYRSISYSAGR